MRAERRATNHAGEEAELRDLTIGIDEAPPLPMQMGDPERGNFRGLEVDLLNKVARRLDAKLRYRRAPWSTIVDALDAGRIDAVCSAATRTDERCRLAEFTDAYLNVCLAVVTSDGAAADPSLAGLRVGVRTETTAAAYVQASAAPASVREDESNDVLYDALRRGELDALVDDSPIASWFSQHVPGLRLAATISGTGAGYAIMVRKGNTGLRDELNATLAAMREDGTLERLRTRWMGMGPNPCDGLTGDAR
jgi:polar amino acid transport system substrate-binding protein